jgi:hypothetical protein
MEILGSKVVHSQHPKIEAFFHMPLSFNVCSCVILVIAARDILGIATSGCVFGTSFSSLHSPSESLLDVFDSFFASQVYSFFYFCICALVTTCLHNIYICLPISYLDPGVIFHLPSRGVVHTG